MPGKPCFSYTEAKEPSRSFSLCLLVLHVLSAAQELGTRSPVLQLSSMFLYLFIYFGILPEKFFSSLQWEVSFFLLILLFSISIFYDFLSLDFFFNQSKS